MRQVKVTVPAGMGDAVARLALDVGIAEASVHPVFTHGPNEQQEVVTLDVSTAEARTFLDALMRSRLYDPHRFTINSDANRSIVSRQRLERLTRPLPMPVSDVIQDLWQQTHVTPHYIARALVAGLLIAYGMMRGSIILVVAGLLFAPFLAQTLAAAYGAQARDRCLIWRGLRALALSAGLSVVAGTVVALLLGPPLALSPFSPPLHQFLITVAVGVMAGLATVDDQGRLELLGLAAAAQLATHAVWFGIVFVLGAPGGEMGAHLAGFLANAAALFAAAVVVYTWLGVRGGEPRRPDEGV